MGNYDLTNGNFAFPGSQLGTQNNIKLNEDQYEVYVNDDFVGHKTLKTQGEKLSDVDHFLQNQGFNGFSSSLNGDHYLIQTNAEDTEDLKNALTVYFNNR
jgi:hypothetical protein